jgi:nitroreductase/NAD-dependent dihydropyrimidine dehydrogenase PreA subunit
VSIPTSRASGAAEVAIDRALCTNCGVCAKVCFGAPLVMRDGSLCVVPDRMFGCIACGACLAVCPTEAITIAGRDLSAADVIGLPDRGDRTSYDQLVALLRARRSCRRFTSADVSEEDLALILEAASTAPMGVPPSDVGVLVVSGREKVRALRVDLVEWLVSVRNWLKPTIPLMRPFVSKLEYEQMRDFLVPAVDMIRDTDEDWLLYDAPLFLFFYGCGGADPADPMVAATYAMVAAESLGLGTCMLGFAPFPFRYSRKVRKRWGLPRKIQAGLCVIVGHPAIRPKRGMRRRFAQVVRA